MSRDPLGSGTIDAVWPPAGPVAAGTATSLPVADWLGLVDRMEVGACLDDGLLIAAELCDDGCVLADEPAGAMPDLGLAPVPAADPAPLRTARNLCDLSPAVLAENRAQVAAAAADDPPLEHDRTALALAERLLAKRLLAEPSPPTDAG